jgi:threonine/homoserine/homoserine lactone efflux protein
MPSLDTLLTFFTVSLVLGITPGPDNLFVLIESARHGWRAGLATVLGLCCGLVVQTCAVAFGLAAVFAASATAFTGLKYCGAAYLVWLAWQALRAPADTVADGAAAVPIDGASASRSLRKTVGRGVLMNLSNPKVLVFFLAFLPQFADPARGAMALQLLVLGGVFILASCLVFGAIAFFSSAFGAVLMRSARARLWLNRVAGLVFLALAARLVMAQQR